MKRIPLTAVIHPFLLFSLIACHQAAQPKQEKPSGETVPSATAPDETGSIPRFHSIADVINDTGYTHWGNYTAPFTSALHFQDQKNAVVMEYYGYCYYTYPIKTSADTIIVYWGHHSECKGDIGLGKKLSGFSPPGSGKPFMLLTLANDSTLHATYLYPEWVKNYNKTDTTTTAFPTVFIARQP
jgi:hypothetical protein